jgi:hypothetical protein
MIWAQLCVDLCIALLACASVAFVTARDIDIASRDWRRDRG